MPDLLTPQTLASAGPLVLDTFLKHFFSHKSLSARSKARGDDLMYDEAFVLMKTFLESATKYPVSSLQKFGMVRTPAPPWVALYQVTVPLTSLSVAADFLIKAFGGDEMTYKIAGGVKWWQVRAGGLEAEWIVMKKDWREYEEQQKSEGETQGKEKGKGRGKGKESIRDVKANSTSSPLEENITSQPGPSTTKRTTGAVDRANEEEGDVPSPRQDSGEGEFRKEMDELRCMYYIHGGAYYWGSINTHRYTMWRYARKMRGRVFAVNYRKAPQYPFPCAIQDCIAGYLYLTQPPPGAKHRPVRPENMIIAGDSAGGGLVLALLQILRDTEGLTLPAGAVLISPWSDLTHSFPSILKNTATDIVPPYSFIHKPSSLWPPPPMDLTEAVQSRLRSRIKEVASHLRSHDPVFIYHPPDDPSHDFKSLPIISKPTSIPDKLRSSEVDKKKFNLLNLGNKSHHDLHPTTTGGDAHQKVEPEGELSSHPARSNPADAFSKLVARDTEGADSPGKWTSLARYSDPIELNIKGEDVIIDTQIQLYATNAQVCHPLVSPVLGYLGGLCPLYICAGDKEVLRDEIIYLAHKAANPEKYPIRQDVRAMMPHYEDIEERFGPTQSHLQVYDGCGHDLPLFSMCRSARGVFRAISTFSRYVTPSASILSSDAMKPKKSKSMFDGKNNWFTGTFGMSSGSGSNTPKATSGTTTPVSKLKNEMALDVEGSDTDSYVTPAQSLTDLTTPASGDVATASQETRKASIPNIALARTDSPKTMSPAQSVIALDQLKQSSDSSKRKDAAQNGKSPQTPLDSASQAEQPDLDDEAGPRWGDEEWNVAAKPGEAGWPGIYRGPNAYKDNMIRERVDTHGRLRPLEPEAELDAMTMPSDEIGMIKEGPAVRYLTGQYLWDKKYKSARKDVAKHREKNLKNARDRDRKKILDNLKDRFEGFRLKREERDERAERKLRIERLKAENRNEGTNINEEGSSSAWETSDDEATEGEDGDEAGDDESEVEEKWSWDWAVEGDQPPPSAIVSRRDTSEARQLALMADRLDSKHGTKIGGLSIWVALATVFSNSSERDHARDALKSAKEEKKRSR